MTNTPLNEQPSAAIQQDADQAASPSHGYPFTTINMEGVPFAPQLYTPVKGTREADERDREINGMYKLFNNLMGAPVELSWITFQRFMPLYMKHVRDTINPMDKSQTEPLRALSEELLKLINPYKEYHVRMPDDTVVTFPPIFSPVGRLDDTMTNALDVFDNILTKCVDQPWRRQDATTFMVAAMYESQNPDVVQFQQKKYEKYAAKIYEQIYASKLPEGMTAAEFEEHVKQQNPSQTSNATVIDSITGVEYVLD